jgi:hypothetical protein
MNVQKAGRKILPVIRQTSAAYGTGNASEMGRRNGLR